MLLTTFPTEVSHGILEAPYLPIVLETREWITESGVVTREMVEADKDKVQVSKRCKRLRDLAK